MVCLLIREEHGSYAAEVHRCRLHLRNRGLGSAKVCSVAGDPHPIGTWGSCGIPSPHIMIPGNHPEVMGSLLGDVKVKSKQTLTQTQEITANMNGPEVTVRGTG